MKKFLFTLGFTLLCIFLIYIVYGATDQIKHPDPKVVKQEIPSQPAVKADINFGKIPLYFISNKGQVNNQAKFYAKASRYTLWMTKEGLVFDSTIKEKLKRQKEKVRNLDVGEKPFQRFNDSTFQRDVSRLMFIGANKNPEIIPLDPAKLKVNYFKGNDPSKWFGSIPTSQAVLYKNLYKNIDLKVYGIEKQIEYDWIVKPGGNPEDIRFEYKNIKKTQIDKDGNLVITTECGELIHKCPVSYQIHDELRGREDERARGSEDHKEEKSKFEGSKQKQSINVAFKKIKKTTYGFEVGEYDKSKELIIDPVVVLAYSTYLGGGNRDVGSGIAIDNSGYVYVTGHTESTDFPCLNQYMSDPGDGMYDVFVTKLDTTQSGSPCLLYSSYLGGGNIDIGSGIAIDNSGYAYVTGYTYSTDFPTLHPYQTDPGDGLQDVFVSKLDTTQNSTASLLYSTYLGGGGEDIGRGIAVDSSDFAYVVGQTDSTDYPTLNQYMTDPVDGKWDIFITKLDTTQSGASCLHYSTYLGGNDYDEGLSVASDSSGNAYVTGVTKSTDFPTLNQYQSYPGDVFRNVFVTQLDTTLSGTASLLYSTYLGGSGEDYGHGIAVDISGYTYVTGKTESTNFPTLNQYMSDPVDGTWDVFITKLDTTQSGTSSLLYSTYLGGSSSDQGSGIAIDDNGYAYVTGLTTSSDFPTLKHYQTAQVNWDAFITKLDTTQSGTACLIYSTYLGGGGIDVGNGIVVNGDGDAYVTGYTSSTDFPCLDQFQTYGGNDDGFVARITLAPKNPIVLTRPISNRTATSATTGGDVVLEGDSAVTVRGACWSTSSNPTIWDNYTIDGSGLGEYTSSITGLTPETTYYVRAYAANDDGLDYGDEIQFTTLPISITVTSPNGGETWCTGTSQDITWTPDGLTNTLYIILQQNDTNVALINKNINPSLGTYTWTVGDCRLGAVVAGVNYKVLLKEKGSTVKDLSDGYFTIVDPYVTVTSPNGGEDWAMSSSQNITWSSAGLTGTLYIVLQQNGVNVALIQKNIDPYSGTYSWTVGDCRTGTVVAGSNCKIVIKEKGTTVKDKSNGVFVINN